MNGSEPEIKRLQKVLLAGRIVRGLRVEGPAPTWLLVPPLGMSAAIYAPLLRELHGRNAAVAVDLAGFGSSEIGKADPGYGEQRAMLAAYLDTLHGALVLVGASTSVPLCVEMARREEHRVDALVVNGFGSVDAESWLQRIEAMSASAESFVQAMLAEPTEELRAQAQANLAMPAYRSFFDRELHSVLRTGFAGLMVPTLLGAARHDPLLSTGEMERAAASLDAARVHWVDGRGQLALAQRPRELVQETRALMEPMRASA